MNRKQGLLPIGISRYNIVDAHAAFADWWNKDGLTARDRDPKRRSGKSASAQLYGSMGYSCGMGSYFEPEDGGAAEVYVALVAKYEGEDAAAKEDRWIAGGMDWNEV